MGNIFNSVNSSHILSIHNASTHYKQYMKKHYQILFDSNSSMEEKKISVENIKTIYKTYSDIFNLGIKYYDYYYPREEALHYKHSIQPLKYIKNDYDDSWEELNSFL